MAERLVLHIGLPKTGTTALQHFLALNRDALARNGILYPELQRSFVPWGQNGNGGVFLEAACSLSDLPFCFDKELGTTKADIEDALGRISSLAGEAETLIISEETMVWAIIRSQGSRYIEALRDTARSCSGAKDIDVLIYLRRQDEWAKSFWKQSVINVHPTTLGFKAWLSSSEPQGIFDYKKLVLRLEEVFGREHVIVRTYERGSFEGGDIFHDFLAALDIPWSGEYSSEGCWGLRSATLDAANGCRGLMKVFGKKLVAKACFIQVYSEEFPDDSRLYPLDQSQRREFLDRYTAGNNWVAARYLGRKSLFDSRIADDDVWSCAPIDTFRYASLMLGMAAFRTLKQLAKKLVSRK